MGEEGVVGRCHICGTGMQAYEHAGKGLKVFGIEHIACHLHGVGLCAGGEDIGEMSERIALVVVLDGVGKVDGIGGIGL